MNDKKREVVSYEVANQAFEQWVEDMDIDTNKANMDQDDLAGFDKQKRLILNAIQDGSLTFNDDGEAVYSPRREKDQGDPITFNEVSGEALSESDKRKPGHDVMRMYAVMGKMTKQHPSRFLKMKGVDIKLCQAIFAFLMD